MWRGLVDVAARGAGRLAPRVGLGGGALRARARARRSGRSAIPSRGSIPCSRAAALAAGLVWGFMARRFERLLPGHLLARALRLDRAHDVQALGPEHLRRRAARRRVAPLRRARRAASSRVAGRRRRARGRGFARDARRRRPALTARTCRSCGRCRWPSASRSSTRFKERNGAEWTITLGAAGAPDDVDAIRGVVRRAKSEGDAEARARKRARTRTRTRTRMRARTRMRGGGDTERDGVPRDERRLPRAVACRRPRARRRRGAREDDDLRQLGRASRGHDPDARLRGLRRGRVRRSTSLVYVGDDGAVRYFVNLSRVHPRLVLDTRRAARARRQAPPALRRRPRGVRRRRRSEPTERARPRAATRTARTRRRSRRRARCVSRFTSRLGRAAPT